jgi:DNA topoisomerase-1
MAANLLIVESPNKIKKIQSLLDAIAGAGNWNVAASVGHVRDLPKSELGVHRDQNYRMDYQVSPDKEDVVARLRSMSRQSGVTNIYLAMDPDREGEAIAWHLCDLLKIDPKSPQRVTFQEITQNAIKTALANCRPVNMNLTRKTGKFLTAGRVQSVAVKLVNEREAAIEAFADKFSYKLTGEFITPQNNRISAQYVGADAQAASALDSPGKIQAYLASVANKSWHVLDVQTRPTSKNPPTPFTTSTLQQEAIKKLSGKGGRWTTKQVMDVAQSLFAAGYITYMRTDSPNLSEEAVLAIEQQVLGQFGLHYFEARRFSVKVDAQEAHEAVRPTHMETPQAGSTPEEIALYRLIYTRAMASQMKAATFEQTAFVIGTGQLVDTFVAKASVLTFEGYRAIYTESAASEETQAEETVIAPVPVGSALKLSRMQGKQTYRQPPKRYDEATLVKDMEAKGIGRPSTYASILTNITKRAYIETATMTARKLPITLLTLQDGRISQASEQQTVGGDKDKLVPTIAGKTIAGFMQTYFATMVDYAFTAQMEKQLDNIVERTSRYIDVITGYDAEHQASITRANTALPDIEKKTVTRLLGDYKQKPVRVGESEKGTYLIYDDSFYNAEAPASAEEMTLAQAIALIEAAPAKQSGGSARPGPSKAAEVLHIIGNYEVKKGQYGFYFTDKQVNVSMPKNVTTLAQVKKLKTVDLDKLKRDYLAYKARKAG